VRYTRIIAIFWLVLTAGIQADAQQPELINNTEFRPVARQAVDSLYNLNPQASHRLLESWKQRYPEHPLWTLFDGMELWWKILSDLEDTSHDGQFFELMSRADFESSRLLRRKSDHADALIIKAIANGYIARQHANRDSWITSLNQARKAYSAYQFLLEIQPGLPDLKLAEGLKLYYSAYLPEKYPIVRTVSWFLPDGDRSEGLRYLEAAADSSIFAQAEARYFLGNINLLYEEEYGEASEHLEQLHRNYPNNGYYARILVRSYFEMRAYDRALTVIEESLNRWESRGLPYREVLFEELLTWKGRILYNRGDYEGAMAAFEEAWPIGKQLPRTLHREQHARAGYYAGFISYQTGAYRDARKYLGEVQHFKGTSYSGRAEQILEKIGE